MVSKIICDICGTTYQDTAECCPICGFSRDAASALLSESLIDAEDDVKARGGRFSTKKKKQIFDYDEANSEPGYPDQEDGPYEEDEEEYSQAPRHNTGAVVFLTVLIAVLLLAAGFLLVRFYLPNMGGDTSLDMPVGETQEQTADTTGYAIPCTNLVLTSGKAELTNEGNYHLLNVIALPENTTDKIVYTSADESIATVSESGRITAVSEGETVIYITCGNIQQTCSVVCRFTPQTQPTQETEPSVQTTAPQETDPTEGTAQTTEATEATTGVEIDPNVELKLQKTDIMLGVYYEYQLKLDCELEQDAVTWTSEHPHIASVDDKGVVKALKKGITSIKATYGDQEVSCIVRCG